MLKFSEYINEGLLKGFKCKKLQKKIDKEAETLNKMSNPNAGQDPKDIMKQQEKVKQMRDDKKKEGC